MLYGHVHPSTAYSTGAWLRDVKRLLADGAVPDAGPPVFVGGTGLYFRALAEGISEMPEFRHRARTLALRVDDKARPSCTAILMREDSRPRCSCKPTDGQRIVRALEVLEASGRSISNGRPSEEGR